MQNPLESEEAAFRFVLGALVYFAAIVVAAWIATWLGVIVFVVMSVLAFVVLRRGTASEPPVVSTERAAVDDTRRILVVTDTLPVGPAPPSGDPAPCRAGHRGCAPDLRCRASCGRSKPE